MTLTMRPWSESPNRRALLRPSGDPEVAPAQAVSFNKEPNLEMGGIHIYLAPSLLTRSDEQLGRGSTSSSGSSPS
jgi:hypothetical protein